MDRASRLKLLFGADEGLLRMNTYLHIAERSAPDPEPADQPAEPQATMEAVPGNEGTKASPQTSDERHAEAPVSKETVHPGSRVETATADKEPGHAIQTDAKLAASFCPAVAVSRYPYKYVRGELSQTIAHHFFDEGKFWNRVWDLYYVPVPGHIGPRPLLLVPASQVQQLLHEINVKFNCTLSLTTNCSPGLVLPFHDDGTPQPLILGQSANKETKAYLESKVRGVRADPTSYAASAEEKAAFETKIQAGVDATKNKRKTSKTERQQERRHAEVESERSVTRIQCYFGLQDAETAIDESFESFGQEKAAASLPPLDLTQAAPFAAWKEPVFISIDVESNEYSHSQVTEVGISVLDTLDLAGVAPGEKGTEWTTRIRSRHFRVSEYSDVVNNNFVSGCPDKFEFGQSEWVALADLVRAIEDCFRAHGARNIIVVGHSIACDVKYLRDLGAGLFDKTASAPQIVQLIDTAALFRAWKKELQQRALGKILAELDIVAWNLHNAGNDARYTLEAAVRIALGAREGETGGVKAEGVRAACKEKEEAAVDSDEDSVPWL